MIDDLFEPAVDGDGAPPARETGRRPWWRARAATLAVVALTGCGLVAGGLVAFAGGPSSSAATSSSPTALATVERRSLSSQDEVTGTLGYAGTYDVTPPVGTPAATLQQDQAAADQAQARVVADQQALGAVQAQAGGQGAAQITAAQAVVDTDTAALAAARRQLQADQRLGCPAASPATVTTPVTAAGQGGDKSGGQAPTAASTPRTATQQASGPPTATTGTVQLATATAVTLTGSVDPHGLATTYYFRYGTTTPLSHRTPTASAGAGAGVDVGAQVAGLSPGTTYAVMLVATNAAGSTTGAVQTFQTVQSSCVAQQQVIAVDGAALADATSNLAATRGSAGASVAQAQAQLTADQAAADAAARTLSAARQRATIGSASTSPAQTITALPNAGAVVHRGQNVYGLDGAPVPLLYGGTVPWRALSAGVGDGPDVAQLQRNLIALGFGAGISAGPHFSAATAEAVKHWQASLGQPQTGQVQLGAYLVEPGPIRVVAVTTRLGQAAQLGTTILQASSTQRQVLVDVDATQQSEVRPGDSVTITLPDNSTTPGVVASVGAVATTPQASADAGGSGASGASGSTATPTITVTIAPTRPGDTGHLDQAPVTVAIKTATVHDALVVPVTALLALAGGGYALETVPSGGGAHRLVAVRLGLFDDADGLVQVIGSGVAAGQQVVVPAKP